MEEETKQTGWMCRSCDSIQSLEETPTEYEKPICDMCGSFDLAELY